MVRPSGLTRSISVFWNLFWGTPVRARSIRIWSTSNEVSLKPNVKVWPLLLTLLAERLIWSTPLREDESFWSNTADLPETSSQCSARRTAPRASTSPKPNLGLNIFPPPFHFSPPNSRQPSSSAYPDLFIVSSTWNTRAEAARMSCTSRAPRFGLASSMRATTPETIGAEKEVPWVDNVLSS